MKNILEENFRKRFKADLLEEIKLLERSRKTRLVASLARNFLSSVAPNIHRSILIREFDIDSIRVTNTEYLDRKLEVEGCISLSGTTYVLKNTIEVRR